jgi:hypothetical protein
MSPNVGAKVHFKQSARKIMEVRRVIKGEWGPTCVFPTFPAVPFNRFGITSVGSMI